MLFLQLGDIKGAFLEAGPLPDKFRPLFAKQPAGGIPGVPSDAVLEVTGNVYGQNDAPLAWHRTFDDESLRIGWNAQSLTVVFTFFEMVLSWLVSWEFMLMTQPLVEAVQSLNVQ